MSHTNYTVTVTGNFTISTGTINATLRVDTNRQKNDVGFTIIVSMREME